ncbi:MAG: TonB-dependent receptor [Bacteroidetes bacterium]|nr:TonB-dependent receptor [Bacteroidota bacterium]
MFRFLSILVVLIPMFCIGQTVPNGKIQGEIINSTTKEPLSNVTILLENNQKSSISDKNGNFIFSNLTEGNYLIKVNLLGFQSFQKKIELKKNQTFHLQISLKDTIFSRREVNITANREHNLIDIPNRITIISSKNIELAPVQNINEMLDYVSGASMSNTFGIFSSKAIVTLRGLPSNDQSRTLITLDGVPLNKSDEGSVNWNMINKNNIESISVIKGPGPAMYGSGAMGGVINIVSKKPTKKLQGSLLSDYGTYNTIGSNLNVSGLFKIDSAKSKSFYWDLSAFGRKSDGYITELDQFITIEDTVLVPVFLKEINTSIKAGYSFNKNHNVDGQFSYFDDKRGNGIKVFDDYGAFSTHRTYSGIMRYNSNFKNFKWNTNLFILEEKYIRIYEYMKEGVYMLYGANSSRGDVGGNFNLSYLKYKQHEITAGINYKLGSVDGTDTYYTSTDIIHNTGKMQTSAVFIQDEMNFFNKKVQINAGLRYDFAKYYDGLFTIDYPSYAIEFYKNFENYNVPTKYWNALCPRLSLQYKFNETNRIYFSVAKGFRAPILDDLSRTGKNKGGFKIANPELKPELITTYELGTDFNILNNLSANTSVYYSIGKDFMYYTSTGDSVNMGYRIAPIFQKENIGKVEIYGIETELKYDLGKNISIFGNYSYTHAQIKEHKVKDINVDSCLVGKYLTDIPNHKVSAGITWINKIINTSFLYKYIGKVWINDLNTVETEYLLTDKYPDYSIFSIRFERNIIKNLSGSLSIENIFDKIYITSDAQKCPGRFITISLKYKL